MNLSEFIKLSWGEIALRVGEAIEKEYGQEYFNYVVEMYDDRAIVRFYSFLDGSSKLMRINYTVNEEGEAILGDIHEVHVVYEDVPETSNENNNMTSQEPTATEEPQGVTNPEQASTQEGSTSSETPAATSETNVTPVTNATENSTDVPSDNTEGAVSEGTQASFVENNDPAKTEEPTQSSATDAAPTAANEETATFAAQDVDANTQTTKEVGAVNEQKQEENSSSAPLTDSERAEFEALKRAQKEELLNSYKEYLSEDEYNGFFATIDSVSKEELETSLLKAYKDFQERENARPVTRVFSLSQLIGNNLKKNENQESELANYIGEMLQR